MKVIKEDKSVFGSRSGKKTGLKIIIVGCGKVGVAILKQLANEGHDITIIDKDPHSETQRPGLQQGGKLSQGEAWTYHDHKP